MRPSAQLSCQLSLSLLVVAICLSISAAAAAATAATAAAFNDADSVHAVKPAGPDPLATLPDRPRASSSRTAAYVHMELLLRDIVAECAKGDDTVLQLDPQGRLQTLQQVPFDAPCPALDIPLRGSERGVGMCTDVAQYLLHMGRTGSTGGGARVIPLLSEPDMAAYSAKCTQTTARMFLQSMYHEWIAPSGTGGYYLMQVNSEHMFKVNKPLHKRINVFLCKTKFCQDLMVQYVTQQGWQAEVWYMGHTSSDVLVSAAGSDSSSNSGSTSSTEIVSSSAQQDVTGSEQSVSPIHADFSQFLHVKGDSGTKHTAELLECWLQHPEFPLLTIIGHTSFKDNTVQTIMKGGVKNVRVLPEPAEDEIATAAVRDMARRLAIAAAAPAATPSPAASTAAANPPVTAAADTTAAPAVSDGQGVPVAAAVADQTPNKAPPAKQFGRRRKGERQVPQALAHSYQQQQQLATEKGETGSSQQQQQTQQPKRQFGRKRKQPAWQQAQAKQHQQQQQNPELLPDSAELAESKKKVQEIFSALGLATRRLLGSSTAAASAARRWLLTSSSTAVAADKDKESLQLAGQYLGWTLSALDKDQLLSFDDTRQIQAASGVQICTSERESFGHCLNEARAAGALVISTDHPPMNELVQDGVSGVLVKPTKTESYTEWQALGGFSPINAQLDSVALCSAVERVLAMPLQQRQQLGQQARQQYLQGKAQFVQKMRVLRHTLHRRRMEGKFQQSMPITTADQ